MPGKPIGLSIKIEESDDDNNNAETSRISSCPKSTFEKIAEDIQKSSTIPSTQKINNEALENIINKKNKTLKRTVTNKNNTKQKYILDLLHNSDIKPLVCNLKNITIDYGDGQGLNVTNDRVYTMYIYQIQNKIYKILYFNNEEYNYCRTHIEFEAFKEIFFTQKAFNLIEANAIKNIRVPKVLKYGIININESTPLPSQQPKYSNTFTINDYISMYEEKPRIAIYIEMEFLKIPILRDALGNILFTKKDDWEDKNKFMLNEKFQEIRTQPDDSAELKPSIIKQFGQEKINAVERVIHNVKTAFDFFMRNNIYHNDESLMNIMYDIDTDTVGIIDFGMATNFSFSTSSASIEKMGYDIYKIIKTVIIIFNTLNTSIIEKEEEKRFRRKAWKETPSAKASAHSSPKGSSKQKNNLTINTDINYVDENAASVDENAASVDENAASVDENAASVDENAASVDEHAGWFGGKKTKQNKKRLTKKRLSKKRLSKKCLTKKRRKTRPIRM